MRPISKNFLLSFFALVKIEILDGDPLFSEDCIFLDIEGLGEIIIRPHQLSASVIVTVLCAHDSVLYEKDYHRLFTACALPLTFPHYVTPLLDEDNRVGFSLELAENTEIIDIEKALICLKKLHDSLS